MWLIFAVCSAFFAGITSILAKCGIRKTDSNVATAVRTIVVLVITWIIVFMVGSQNQITQMDGKTILFLVLSGMATGASWLCYFRALQLGEVSKVVPIDKSGTILTILLSLLIFQEGIRPAKMVAILIIAAGIWLMVPQKKVEESTANKSGSWFFYACGSAVFGSLTAILGKLGIQGVESNLGTAIRTGIVLIMAWMMVFLTGKQKEVRKIDRKELIFICTSGVATGASWLCYYRALQEGPASIVVPMDKLSILVSVLFSYFVFGERLDKRELTGLFMLTAATVAMVFL